MTEIELQILASDTRDHLITVYERSRNTWRNYTKEHKIEMDEVILGAFKIILGENKQ